MGKGEAASRELVPIASKSRSFKIGTLRSHWKPKSAVTGVAIRILIDGAVVNREKRDLGIRAVECAPADSTRGSTSSFMWEGTPRIAIPFPISSSFFSAFSRDLCRASSSSRQRKTNFRSAFVTTSLPPTTLSAENEQPRRL